MVQIKIKGLKDGLHLFAQFDDEKSFLKELEKRLKAISVYGKVIEAFFHIPDVSDETWITLFMICERNHVLIKGLDETCEKDLRIKEATLYNGQIITLTQDTLWIGDMRKGAYVHALGSLYVIGHVEAIIDLWHKEDILVASSITSSVRICDSTFQNVTSFAPIKAYYNKEKVLLKAVKGGALWEKSLPLHQEKAGLEKAVSY